MIRLPVLACIIILFQGVQAQPKASGLIPKPVQCRDLEGFFELKPGKKIYAPREFSGAAGLLAELWRVNSGMATAPGQASVVFERVTTSRDMGLEGYSISISPGKITIGASTFGGAVHAVFSLIQLQLMQPGRDKIPCAEIIDNPRFPYRGMHLDVSRNFFPVSFIKKYLDLMALYKYNTFHWHLTDGPGWRLEIAKYPDLTRIAAFRTHKAWTDWWKSGRKYSSEGDPNGYGGYYTRQEAKDIVAYAARRGITVIPEIEMPGHSEEVLAVFPELSCSGEPYRNSEFCIGNPGTLKFLEDVLTEVMEIFPSTYIHVGGDEANTKPWSECEKCQKLKAAEGLKNEHELQAYLMKQVEKFLKDHGRRLLGWDEILEGGLPADATVMSWRGMGGGIRAIGQGHDVIMTPGETYLDAYQSDPSTQPEAIGGFLPLSRVYQFDPLPEGIPAGQQQHLLGTQANLWTEYMPTTYQVEYMAWPRALALSEVAWSKKEERNFDDFQRRLQDNYLVLQRLNVNYYRPSLVPTFAVEPDYDRRQDRIVLGSELYRPAIRYTTDGTEPTASSTLYTGPFFTAGKTEIRAAIFRDNVQLGKASACTADYHKAIGRKVIFNTRWSDSYPAQKEQTLTNGIRGSLSYGDRQWLGYLRDFDVTIDMDSVQMISSVSVKFMHQPGPGVFLPKHVELQVSDDGKTFSTVGKLTHDFDPENKNLGFKSFDFEGLKQKTRYIRLIGPNVMKGFMFVDEVVVY